MYPPRAMLGLAARLAMILLVLPLGCTDLGSPLPQAPDPDPDPEALCLLSGSSLDFGEVDLGNFADLSLALRNQGDLDLSGSASSNSVEFSLLSGGGNFLIAPGDSLEIEVRFTPSAAGNRTAVLGLGSDCATVPFSGIGRDITAPGVSLANDLQPLFSNSCATSGCHLGISARANLELSNGRTFSETVGVVSDGYGPAFVIKKNDPDASVLYNKVANTGTFGGPMPPRSNRFTPAQIAMLRDWILAGAPDN